MLRGPILRAQLNGRAVLQTMRVCKPFKLLPADMESKVFVEMGGCLTVVSRAQFNDESNAFATNTHVRRRSKCPAISPDVSMQQCDMLVFDVR
jgi:hypothetical protein